MSGIDRVGAFLETRFKKEIRAHKTIASVPGEFGDYPAHLHPRLREVLANQNIASLYEHQNLAFESI